MKNVLKNLVDLLKSIFEALEIHIDVNIEQ